jgi:hypothetical protein
MSFGGFIARRIVKGVVNGVIDNIADSKDDAKKMKEGARWLITGVGVAASILTADPVGFADAIVDHGTDTAIDHGVDTLADHGTDIAVEHISSYHDPSDYHHDYGTSTHSSSDNSDMKFSGYSSCDHYNCGCTGFVGATGGSVCLTCGHAYSDHW